MVIKELAGKEDDNPRLKITMVSTENMLRKSILSDCVSKFKCWWILAKNSSKKMFSHAETNEDRTPRLWIV